jgi:hypothetical protein
VIQTYRLHPELLRRVPFDTLRRLVEVEAGMLVYWKDGNFEFTKDVEDWMADHNFTEVFNYSLNPVTKEEMDITYNLDLILHEVRYGWEGIKQTLEAMSKGTAKIVQGRQPGKKETSLGRAEGGAVDGVFKEKVDTWIKKEKISSNLLRTTRAGHLGVDVVSDQLKIAWDVTTKGDVWKHVRRDVFGKRKKISKPRLGAKTYDRYYILVWDEPRAHHISKVEAIQEGRVV